MINPPYLIKSVDYLFRRKLVNICDNCIINPKDTLWFRWVLHNDPELRQTRIRNGNLMSLRFFDD